MATVNSLSTKTLRDKYRSAQLAHTLKNAVISEKICLTDHTDAKTITAPRMTAMTATISAINGLYTPAVITTTDEVLTVDNEIKIAAQIKDYEEILSNFNLFFATNKEMIDRATVAVDVWVLNNLCEDGTGAISTPVGGFTTPANVQVIISEIVSKTAAYADPMGGSYLVLENTDLTGVIQAQTNIGFTRADAAATNGLLGQMSGVDIYVVRSGTFINATTTGASGTKTWTNSGHRVAGVKNVATYAAPRGLKFTEKDAGSGNLATEVVLWGLMGFKQWADSATLTLDITLN